MEDLVVNGLAVKPINYIAEKVSVNVHNHKGRMISPDRSLASDSTV